jgi:plastocyanin
LRRRGAVAALAVAVAATGVVSSTPTGAQVEPAAVPDPTLELKPPERVVDVRIGDNYFRRKKIRVRPGTTVRWRNAGRNEHNVLPNRTFRGADRFGVDDIPRGETYSYRFDEPGRYGYYCSFHGAPRTGQFGTVVVKARDDAKRSRDASKTDDTDE